MAGRPIGWWREGAGRYTRGAIGAGRQPVGWLTGTGWRQPLAQQHLNEPLRLAVRPRSVGARADVLHADDAARFAEQPGDVIRAIVGHDTLDADAAGAEPASSAPESPSWCRGASRHSGLGRQRPVLVWKQLPQGAFRWPPVMDGMMKLSAVEFAALFDGFDWTRVQAVRRIPALGAAA